MASGRKCRVTARAGDAKREDSVNSHPKKANGASDKSPFFGSILRDGYSNKFDPAIPRR